MIDLEHLNAFDDDAPPSPDLGQARSRAGRLRTRNRLAAFGAGVAVLVIAVGVIVAVGGRDHRVEVGGQPGSTVPDGLSARLHLPTATYPSGYSLQGAIVFVNGTGAPIEYRLDCTQAPPWTVVLSKDGFHFDIPEAAIGCRRQDLEAEQLAPGTTRVPFYVGLTYTGCTGDGATGPASPRCVNGGIPNLPPGMYQLVFEGRGAPFTGLDVAPLTIDVTARP